MQSTNFDEVLELEQEFYSGGYQQGLADGIEAGRIEGRNFGLEKGFEKYVESGRLNGRGIVWANRIPQGQEEISASDHQSMLANDRCPPKLPQLPANPRLAKHVTVLYALAESESLSTENTEDAVSDFDDRFKRGQAKAKIIEKMVGEVKGEIEGSAKNHVIGSGSIEDDSALNARH